MKQHPAHALRATALAAALALGSALAPAPAIAGPAEECQQAEKEFDRGDLIAAMALWRKSANAGYAKAQVRLATIADKAEEDDEAVAWYRKAAAQNDAAGLFGLGMMFAKGEGVKPDMKEARAYVLRAAEQNLPEALDAMMQANRLGGLGLEPNPAEAAAWEAKLNATSPEYVKQVAAEKARLQALEEAREKDKSKAKRARIVPKKVGQ